MNLIGKLLSDRYEVIEKIGVGGMATVYKAKDTKLNRCVAVKVLKDEFANDQEFIKRFQIEAQSAASLSQTNIVSIYDVANEGDIHYIVMELVEGKTLKDIIQKEGKIEWKTAAKIASQIAAGLSTAHKNHIIHRDIKPHNIIITRDGIAKITDFGIAKAASSSTINAKSSSLGSVHYFSPEHARGGYTDEKSDIYSLGIVLYEMVTGKLPFDGDSAVVVAMKHLKDDPIEPIKLESSIPEGLNDIIMKAMHKEVSGRYLNANEMYNDLQKIIKSPDTLDVGKNAKDRAGETQRVPVVKRQINSSDIERGKAEQAEPVRKNGINMSKGRKKVSGSNIVATIFIRIFLILAIFAGVAFGSKYLFDKLMEPTETRAVPNLIGSSSEKAETLLKNLGFQIEVVDILESEYPKGYVIKQKYESGEIMTVGTKVGVWLSAGQEQVVVPDVVNHSVTAATKALRDVNLQIEVIEEENMEVDVDKVFKQDPEAGVETYTGEVVKVYVSKGLPEGMVYMPDLFEFTEARAVEVLEGVGLVPVVKYTNSPDREEGVLLSQSIDPNEKIEEGTQVTLVYNRIGEPDEPEESQTPDTTATPHITTQTPAPIDVVVTPIPTKAPENGSKYLNINLSSKGSRETFNVRVELNGDIKGRKVIYNEEHKRGDGMISVPYPDDATGMIRVYIDGDLDSEQMIS